MLGSVSDAEDIVQETWLRWSAADRSEIDDPLAYLVRITSRLGLNRIRDNKSRRESYIGPWLPEPLLISGDVAEEVTDRIERDHAVSMAMLVVLESLSPAERAVFVLREVFGMAHDEVATALGRSPDAVRQLAHRARSQVQARRPRFDAEPAVQQQVTERFLAACATGDLANLLELLAPDVQLVSDGGGKTRAALRAINGAAKVARFMIAIIQDGLTGASVEFTNINGESGVAICTSDGQLRIGMVELSSGRIARVLIFANPDKLSGMVGQTGPRHSSTFDEASGAE